MSFKKTAFLVLVLKTWATFQAHGLGFNLVENQVGFTNKQVIAYLVAKSQ